MGRRGGFVCDLVEAGAGFLTAIVEERGPPPTLEQALVVKPIMDGIYTSADSGETVDIGNHR